MADVLWCLTLFCMVHHGMLHDGGPFWMAETVTLSNGTTEIVQAIKGHGMAPSEQPFMCGICLRKYKFYNICKLKIFSLDEQLFWDLCVHMTSAEAL